jgi:hypothetical protein
LSHIAPPPLCHEVGSSSHHRTATPPSRMQEVGSSSRRRTAPPHSSDLDDSVEMSVLAPPPPLRLQVAPLTPTRIWECPHIKEVSSYEHCF